jgi:outer membrane protein TolC
MRRRNELAQAEAIGNSSRQYLKELERQVVLQVRESLLRREEAGKKLDVARAAYLSAEEGLRLIDKRFSGSLATMVEVLDAQTALNRARLNIVEMKADYLLATARVWHSAGVFLKEVMK